MTYIGVDLDNTLINYEPVFPVAANRLNISLPPLTQTKNQIREFLRLQPEGEKIWQRLQGMVYGKYLKEHAKIFPGVKRFLWRCGQHRRKVVVISHKSKYGHMDSEKIPLRETAINFLEEQCLINKDNISKKNIIFKNTRGEKLSHISKCDFEWFIDDLPAVVDELNNLKKFKVIHFNPAIEKKSFSANTGVISLSDWQQIDTLINGDWTLSEINQLSQRMINEKAKSIEKISSGGNSATYRLTMQNDRMLKLKVYPVDPEHDRLTTEFMATKCLSNSNYVSKPIEQDKELVVGIFDWIEGSIVETVNDNDIDLCLKFLGEIEAIKEQPKFANFPLASSACLSGHDIKTQINNRLKIFLDNDFESNELEVFLKNKLVPASKIILDWSQQNWPKDILFDVSIPRHQQILSPSDFGFHNAIRRSDGTLVFLDFEYFGWDDPVKLISDFSFHPGMNLSNKQIIFWIKNSLELYGKHISKRLRVCRPLYGLIWCLILLNDFNPQFWQRRLMASNIKKMSKNEILACQLNKANRLLDSIITNYKKSSWMTYN